MSEANWSAPSYIPLDVPTPARLYDYTLGGKENFAVDRKAAERLGAQFPEGLDITRENRLFLYRVVRFLARDAAIRQFLDLGSGLPTQDNVHEVAQRFQPAAPVVYVDNDPIVLAQGQALLAEETRNTTVIQADMTAPAEILANPEVEQLLDFAQPVAALFLSVAHSVPDDDQARAMVATVAEALPAGSFVAFSQLVGADQEAAQANTRAVSEVGLAWKTRSVAEVHGILPELEAVPPGLVEVAEWRPDPDQPPLAPVHESLRQYVGAAARNKQVYEYGGVLHKTG